MAKWLRENNQDKAIKVILFIISPFFSCLYSLRRINTRSSYVVFFLFAVFFGMAFTPPLDSGFDGADYRRWFEENKNISSSQFYDGFKDFLTFDEGKKDYYFETVSFYISRITDNYHIMFMVIAIVFAFFALKSFHFFTKEDKFDKSLASYILVYLFMINQIFNINGVRMWTAAWIGVYALFQIFGKGNKRYFLLLLTTPFFHGSFWIFIAVVVLAYLLMRFDKVWVVAFFISFFVGSVAVELLQDASDSLPVFMQSMIASYTDADTIARRNQIDYQTFDWVARLMNLLVRFYLNFMVFLFIKNSTSIKANAKTKAFYLFILVYMSFVNFTMPVPSLGGRYIVLAYPIIAYIWLVNFKGVKYQKFLYIMPVIFLQTIHTQIFSYYLKVLSIDFFVSSPFYLIYKYLIA